MTSVHKWDHSCRVSWLLSSRGTGITHGLSISNDLFRVPPGTLYTEQVCFGTLDHLPEAAGNVSPVFLALESDRAYFTDLEVSEAASTFDQEPGPFVFFHL